MTNERSLWIFILIAILFSIWPRKTHSRPEPKTDLPLKRKFTKPRYDAVYKMAMMILDEEEKMGV